MNTETNTASPPPPDTAAPPPPNTGTDTSQQEAAPPDHEPPAANDTGMSPHALQQSAHEADPANVPPPGPIPSDDVLEAETDMGLVMFMAAHGLDAAESRDDAITKLKAHRDKPVAPMPEPVVVGAAEDRQAEREAAKPEVPAIVAQDGSTPGSAWNQGLQAWIMPPAA